jgi:hypothetical protein
MPIRPENKGRYPADWKQIRAAILERAGNCCEQCKVANGARIARGTGESADTFMDAGGYVFDADTGMQLGRVRHSDYECSGKWTNVVLTIAHLDHTPENCAPENLKALCQRCHLRYDAAHHAETARATRKARKAVSDLFEG